jgi:hypothetical protein
MAAMIDNALRKAVEELLEAYRHTIFYDCAYYTGSPEETGDDDMSVDGGSCPLTVGHFRRLERALREETER